LCVGAEGDQGSAVGHTVRLGHWPSQGRNSGQNQDTKGARELRRFARPWDFCSYETPLFWSGEDGIRTRGGGMSPLTGLANRRYRPLSHLSFFSTNHLRPLACCSGALWNRS